MAGLDSVADRGDTWNRVADVSTETLSLLVRAGLRFNAEPGDSGLLAFLVSGALQEYLHKSLSERLPREPVLRLFLQGCTATEAGRQVGIADRTARFWVSDFAAFLRQQAKHESERQRRIDAAWAYCAESCGRKKFHGPSAPERRTANANTAKTPRAPGSRCPSCPLTALGV